MGATGAFAKNALKFGEQVVAGMTGNSKSLAKEAGKKILKSNMSKEQLREHLGEKVFDSATKQAAKTIAKHGLTGESARKAEANVFGKAIAQTSLGYKTGNFLGAGIRDTGKAYMKDKNIKNALKAGFTTTVNGKETLNMGRIAGAGVTASLAGRAVTGGGLYRDRYGRVNVPGVPFI